MAIVSLLSLGITFFLTDRSHWRKILLVIGIVAAALSGLQAYSNRQRADSLRNELGTLQQKQEYWEVARLNAFGLHFIGGDLQDHTELNNIIGAYIHDQNGRVTWDCSPTSIEAYTKAVNFDPKFPFSYFYRASCYRLSNATEWQKDADTAQRLFRVTTQIPGHNQNHDEILKMLDRGDLGHPPG